VKENQQQDISSQIAAHEKWARQSHWMFPAIWTIVCLLPAIYAFQIEIPPDDELMKTEGAFFYEPVHRRGRDFVVLKQTQKKEIFTCAASYLSSASCLITRGWDVKTLFGKDATVWWFDQKLLPIFPSSRRVVRLVVDGKEFVSRPQTVVKAKETANRLSWFLIITMVISGLMAFYEDYVVYKLKKRKVHHEQEHG
jgi:hypothetical protein